MLVILNHRFCGVFYTEFQRFAKFPRQKNSKAFYSVEQPKIEVFSKEELFPAHFDQVLLYIFGAITGLQCVNSLYIV